MAKTGVTIPVSHGRPRKLHGGVLRLAPSSLPGKLLHKSRCKTVRRRGWSRQVGGELLHGNTSQTAVVKGDRFWGKQERRDGAGPNPQTAD